MDDHLSADQEKVYEDIVAIFERMTSNSSTIRFQIDLDQYPDKSLQQKIKLYCAKHDEKKHWCVLFGSRPNGTKIGQAYASFNNMKNIPHQGKNA